jgi:hypothetical protein
VLQGASQPSLVVDHQQPHDVSVAWPPVRVLSAGCQASQRPLSNESAGWLP